MTSPKRTPLLPLRRPPSLRSDGRLRYTVQGFFLGALATFAVHWFGTLHRPQAVAREVVDDGLDDGFDVAAANAPLHLFIAIGSAPRNAALRAAAREGWLRWGAADARVTYRFFTDARGDSNDEQWRVIEGEGDVVQMAGVGGGYGTHSRNAYGRRALWQLRWALRGGVGGAVGAWTHFLRVDDDSFLCLHRLLYELHAAPRRQFFWGRYWCAAARHRADESYMLLTRDVARLVAQEAGALLPFDGDVTFGWNFGYLAWVLNLTVFDDQRRIDSQQGYLTTYMHAKANEAPDARVAAFCDRYLYAHHVRPHVMRAAYNGTRTHAMYALPRLSAPSDGCPRQVQSFAPARHSSKLPDIVMTRPLA